MRTLLGIRPTTAVQDLVLLVLRVGLGVVLMAHGWQKLDDQGLGATADGFAGMGIPAAESAAYYATFVELIGGGLLVLGALTPLVALLVVGDMAGAFWFAHRDGGVFVADGGWELVLLIGLGALTLLGTGAGRLSVDRWIAGAAPAAETTAPSTSEPATGEKAAAPAEEQRSPGPAL